MKIKLVKHNTIFILNIHIFILLLCKYTQLRTRQNKTLSDNFQSAAGKQSDSRVKTWPGGSRCWPVVLPVSCWVSRRLLPCWTRSPRSAVDISASVAVRSREHVSTFCTAFRTRRETSPVQVYQLSPPASAVTTRLVTTTSLHDGYRRIKHTAVVTRSQCTSCYNQNYRRCSITFNSLTVVDLDYSLYGPIIYLKTFIIWGRIVKR